MGSFYGDGDEAAIGAVAILDADVTGGNEGFVRRTGAEAYSVHKSNLTAGAPPTVDDDDTLGYSAGSVWINTATGEAFVCVDPSTGLADWKITTGGVSLSLHVLGDLGSLTLPAGDLGSELIGTGATLTRFQARREVVGTAGTTTVQLEVNGAPVAGATLSWTPADGAYALKSVVIDQAVVVGDRVSLRVTSSEVGAETIHAEVGV